MLPIFSRDWTIPMLFGRAQRCHHRCACGAELLNCGGDPDRCVVGERWTCPSCDLAALDAYLESVAREYESERRK